ncbi:hypothetical protein MES5069_450056 [Mesorhizobium escarrei]|uniref:Uncharacterized protein n=1 Tax=Mesorhizobium escarrei TaxID=666018 RepID=A0ABM9E7M0_9HYPH|nr:hypothetical protein MES5069_450056 [Mesorhizobium escarrei]
MVLVERTRGTPCRARPAAGGDHASCAKGQSLTRGFTLPVDSAGGAAAAQHGTMRDTFDTSNVQLCEISPHVLSRRGLEADLQSANAKPPTLTAVYTPVKPNSTKGRHWPADPSRSQMPTIPKMC